jgi:hypothetical protein
VRKNLALLAVVMTWPALGLLLRHVGPSTPMPVVVIVLDLVLTSVLVAALYTAIADGPGALAALARRRRPSR